MLELKELVEISEAKHRRRGEASGGADWSESTQLSEACFHEPACHYPIPAYSSTLTLQTHIAITTNHAFELKTELKDGMKCRRHKAQAH